MEGYCVVWCFASVCYVCILCLWDLVGMFDIGMSKFPVRLYIYIHMMRTMSMHLHLVDICVYMYIYASMNVRVYIQIKCMYIRVCRSVHAEAHILHWGCVASSGITETFVQMLWFPYARPLKGAGKSRWQHTGACRGRGEPSRGRQRKVGPTGEPHCLKGLHIAFVAGFLQGRSISHQDPDPSLTCINS